MKVLLHFNLRAESVTELTGMDPEIVNRGGAALYKKKSSSVRCPCFCKHYGLAPSFYAKIRGCAPGVPPLNSPWSKCPYNGVHSRRTIGYAQKVIKLFYFVLLVVFYFVLLVV